MFYREAPTPCAGMSPSGVLPCVWMSAGLIAFKLCDREGECEGCPFDEAMRGPRRSPRIEAAPPRDVAPIGSHLSRGAGRSRRAHP